MASHFRRLAVGTVAFGAGACLTTWLLTRDGSITLDQVHAAQKERRAKRQLPTRDEQIKSLQTEDFDVLIIGGGASGSGCALDAVTRGLRTALVEMDDFASGTSSRSTKLIHGGVRYLQKAIMKLDIDQYRMVKEALHERANMLTSAPHLNHPLPIMLPVYTWWQIPYYWFGIKMYDVVAGAKTLKSSYFLSKKDALELFPMLQGDKLCGAIVYYDGQMDDARMCLSVALTATRHGATVANHIRVTKLLKEKDPSGKPILCGASLRDEITGKEWDVRAKCIINATGPMTDTIRKMDNPTVKEICCPSSGVHIVLPGYYSPDQMGLLDPDTSDGRVIFFLPWLKHTIAGTTDLPCKVTHNPKPTEDEILFILEEVKNYLNPDVEVRRGDVLSAWSGIRPLVSDPNKEDTQSLARNHIVHVSDSKLVTIAGGKWTTFRAMAEHTIDAAIKACDLKPVYEKCQTDGLRVEGAHNWTPTLYIRLVQDVGLECEVAQHLAQSYGDRAFNVAKLASLTGKRWPIIGKKIHPEFPYIDAEIRYAVKEYACTAIDVIARRLRLAFLNVQAAQEALPTIVDILAEELKWSNDVKKKHFEEARAFLQNEMGQAVNRVSRDKLPINLSKDEIQSSIKRFQIIDKDRKGYVSITDIRRSLQHTGEEVSGEELHEILREIDTNMNGQVELDEYLQMMSAIKSGHVAYSRFARMAEMEEEHHERELLKKQISVERSGGGL
ncbi:glycerol-3-phosphate dehydrogenase, mitochondrial [Zootermopsis nevadensis]|uniref:Glycerol-3-phosphate dehydrogenase n=1 Tax=Zootermopsis nevadensis TaxID=136037 RepID=A0A067RNM6_ZOONE|nr:glycerol-3-phosphate dehydrogenase, mitochondrial [Zootermopsis nevadensis]XP_021916253.1 glycerol-3-phosphate dehydrogenase, mitochondrial [Zootermopsis nevadensis]XP_021916255.1 glycerol-3-phosphate dehydrogenase, mitochondrial [Zootermopsis nevadensis]KDR21344.1 Glycerol-3-phosphate dehydrogenase, mitochondrial [Zootermopsis nevadensis]